VKPIRLIRVSHELRAALLNPLADALSRTFGAPCRIGREIPDISFALDPERRQYWSTAILQRLEAAAEPGERVLGVTACDLYVPVLTFVFGEAQLEGDCALVSTARLSENFYGMPPREELERERLVKESVHELGHTFGLRHCANWRCVMSSSHAVERLDVKEAGFCRACRRAIGG
jgi:archaemetzincin